MEMKGWRLAEREWREWLEALARAGKRIIAPVKEDGLVLFRPVASAAEIALADYENSRWSAKEFLFPRTEPLFAYRFQGDEVSLEEARPDGTEQVLFGLRPCDAAGLRQLDHIFLGEEEDPLYAQRRKLTTVVSLACDKSQPECFCTAVGGSPGGMGGSDLQLISLGNEWLLRAVTQKGETLASAAASRWTPASDKDWGKAEEQRLAVEQGLERNPVPAEWAQLLERSFDHPVWEGIGRRCLSCGICAYVCPSCSCFDMNDEGNAWCGVRCRSWDSCTFAQFTRHASGHNPRPTQASRYRQRVLHKFAYFPLQHQERSMCVGCGRCLKLCPVGMDISRSVQRAVSAATSKEGVSEQS